MGKAATELAAPTSRAGEFPDSASDADELLADMADQEIDRMLTEAQVERPRVGIISQNSGAKQMGEKLTQKRTSPGSQTSADPDTALATQIDSMFDELIGEPPLSKREKRERAEARLKQATAWASSDRALKGSEKQPVAAKAADAPDAPPVSPDIAPTADTPQPAPSTTEVALPQADAVATVNALLPEIAAPATEAVPQCDPTTPDAPGVATVAVVDMGSEETSRTGSPSKVDLLAALDALDELEPERDAPAALDGAPPEGVATAAGAPFGPESDESASPEELAALFNSITQSDAPPAPVTSSAESDEVETGSVEKQMLTAAVEPEAAPLTEPVVVAEASPGSEPSIAGSTEAPATVASAVETPAVAAAPAVTEGATVATASAEAVVAAVAPAPIESVVAPAPARKAGTRFRMSPVVRWLEFINAPLIACGDAVLGVVGKVAIVTLVNALLILLYVIFFRK